MKKSEDASERAREKSKARDLRNSQWWKNRVAEGKCHHCGIAVHPSELTMDHLLPISRGGKSVRSNVVPSCKKCNSERKNFMPAELILKTLFPDNMNEPHGDPHSSDAGDGSEALHH